MNDFSTLREYQEYLQHRMDAAKASGIADKIILLGFSSGGKQYLIDGRDVVEVYHRTTLEPIPLAKPWAVGAANIKGSVYAITDLSLLLGGERTKNGKFLVISPEIIQGSAIIIESISGLFDLSDLGDFIPASDAQSFDWVIGSYYNGQQSYLLDAHKLSQDIRFSKLQSGSGESQ